MQSKDARAAGESEQCLYGLDAWCEAPYYSDREGAALAWTEAITLITTGHVPDEVYAQVREQLAAVTINAWNRIAIAFRARIAAAQTP